ncbi:hypothetical protein KIN20_013977 [Parelaphostrongylus tenuis]|uniref:Protein kinase domain-containing protein n=1 Tax=Parelaphostrongylus tenuis TaxID=148309 RepID=A0AAD5QP36_PARTN|nr:hypothetical protein KIN20_013977 [Parelaphostrongylus tenuis]
MKDEKKIEQRRYSKLKMEIAILKLVAGRRKQSHFTSIIDRGKKDMFFFLVMELVGKSLADLKASRPNKVFTVPTSMGASIQCLEACEDLHKHGFIHRDWKPANYACGLGYEERVACILDFGIARKFTNVKGELKAPRQSVDSRKYLGKSWDIYGKVSTMIDYLNEFSVTAFHQCIDVLTLRERSATKRGTTAAKRLTQLL